jgi:toxin FitB
MLFDTNVVSEPMRPEPDRNVLGWLDAQAAESLYLSAVSLAEPLLGIEWRSFTLTFYWKRSILT